MNLIFASKNCVQEKLLKVIQSRNKKTIFVCSQRGGKGIFRWKEVHEITLRSDFSSAIFNSVTKRECSQTVVKM